MLTCIKNWLGPGGGLSFFNLASFPVLCPAAWICVSLDSEGIFVWGAFFKHMGKAARFKWRLFRVLLYLTVKSRSLVLVASVLDSQEANGASWPVTSAFTFCRRARALTGLGWQGFRRPGMSSTWSFSGSLRSLSSDWLSHFIGSEATRLLSVPRWELQHRAKDLNYLSWKELHLLKKKKKSNKHIGNTCCVLGTVLVFQVRKLRHTMVKKIAVQLLAGKASIRTLNPRCAAVPA